MKTQIQHNISQISWLRFPFTLASLLIIAQAGAQQRDLYFGMESTYSSRQYTVHSDLKNLSGKKLVQEGRTYGVVFGSSLAMGKFSFGSFSSEGSTKEVIKSSSIELALHISPLQLLIKQDRVFEPYLVSSVETTKVNSDGTFTPPKTAPKTGDPTASNSCGCTCPNASPPSPAPALSNDPVPYSGNYGTTRINLGVGLNIHLTKGNMFLNLFGEMRYGIPAGTTASTQALLYTYALKQVAYSTGVSLGISKNRSHGRLRRNRFR